MGWARSLMLCGVTCPRQSRWGGDREPGSPELGCGGDGLYLCVILCCQVSCAGGEGVHSATVLKMILALISFPCLTVSWISLQNFSSDRMDCGAFLAGNRSDKIFVKNVRRTSCLWSLPLLRLALVTPLDSTRPLGARGSISKNGNARKAGCSLQIPASTYL